MNIEPTSIALLTVLAAASVYSLVYIFREARHYYLLGRLQRLDLQEASPSRVHLQPCERYGWMVEPEVQHTLRELEVLGYVQAGSYRIVEMPGLHIIGLVHPKVHFIACLYADMRGTTWVDMSAMSLDGEMITTSNSLNQELLQAEPSQAIYVDKSWSVAELYAQQSQRCEGKSLRAFKGFSFEELFVQAYARDMQRLNEGGGVLSKKLFSYQQELAGAVLTEDELESLYAAYVYRCGVVRLHEECRKEFVRESFLDTQVFPEETLLAVHDQIPSEMLLPFVVEQLALDAPLESKMELLLAPEAQVQARFARANDALPADIKAVYLGEVARPVRAHIYAMPGKI